MGCSNSGSVKTKDGKTENTRENPKNDQNLKTENIKEHNKKLFENEENKSKNIKEENSKKEEKKEKEKIEEKEEKKIKEEKNGEGLVENLEKNIQSSTKEKEEDDNSLYKNILVDLTEDKKKNIDQILEKAPKREETTLEELLNYLKTNSNNLSELERAWLIFKWLTINIEYDEFGAKTGAGVSFQYKIGSETTVYYANSEESIFKLGKAVCQGYARLFKKMGEYLNLEVNMISGDGKGEGSLIGEVPTGSNHAWNSVKINGDWYLIDATWGRNNGDIQNVKVHYFCTNPEYFIRSHFPEEEKWQLLKKPVKKEEYTKMMFIKPDFYTYGFRKIIPDSTILKIDQEGQIKLLFDKTKPVKILADLYLLQANTYSPVSGRTFIQKFDGCYYFSFLIDKRGDYKFIIFGNDGSSNTYPELLSYNIKGTNKNKIELSYPNVGYNFKNEEFLLIEPTHKDLIKNSKVNFKVKVAPNIENLSIKSQNSEIKMNKLNDNIYEVNDVIVENNLSIYAYINGDSYSKEFLTFKAIEKYNLLESIIGKVELSDNFKTFGFISIEPDVSIIKTNDKGEIKIFFDKTKYVDLKVDLGKEKDGILEYSDKNLKITQLEDHFLIEFKLDEPGDYSLRLCGCYPSPVKPNPYIIQLKTYEVLGEIKIIPEDD